MEGEVLRDDQRDRIKPFVPGGMRGKRGPRSNGRLFFDALLWLARSGARWRDLPDRLTLGPGQQNDMVPACDPVRDIPAQKVIADKAYGVKAQSPCHHRPVQHLQAGF